MKKEITVPSLGESVSGGILSAWLKQDGSYVSEGEEIFELESDKATMSVPSPVSGTLALQVQEGEEVEVGQVVAVIDTSAEKPEKKPEPDDAGPPADKPQAKAPLSPAVRRITTEYGLDPEAVKGTGKKGRILKEDALTAAEKGSENPQTETGTQTRKTMSNLRKKIAANLVSSRQNSAHTTTFNEIDMSNVISLRKKHNTQFTETYGIKLGFLSFFVKACCTALKHYPQANGFIEGDDIVYNHYYNIGIAVSTGSGLIVPVLKNADSLSFAEIEQSIADLAEKARNKRLSPSDLTGGTFTITNGGIFGSLLSTPIPSPSQSAILGMHAIQERPIALEGEILIRPMMYIALTYDHRIMDGREAVLFLKTVKTLVEEPEKMLLNLLK